MTKKMAAGGKASSFRDMTAGSGSGLGRLQKTSIAAKTKTQKLKVGGMVKGYYDGGVMGGSGENRSSGGDYLSEGDRLAMKKAGLPEGGDRSMEMAAYRARQDAAELAAKTPRPRKKPKRYVTDDTSFKTKESIRNAMGDMNDYFSKRGTTDLEAPLSSPISPYNSKSPYASSGMKKGGRVSASSYNDMTGGAGGGMGRLQKTSIASKTTTQKLKKGGMAYMGEGGGSSTASSSSKKMDAARKLDSLAGRIRANGMDEVLPVYDNLIKDSYDFRDRFAARGDKKTANEFEEMAGQNLARQGKVARGGMTKMAKGGKAEAFEGSAMDMVQDNKLAKKYGMSKKDYEKSSIDAKHDKQQNMKGLKMGGMSKMAAGGMSTAQDGMKGALRPKPTAMAKGGKAEMHAKGCKCMACGGMAKMAKGGKVTFGSMKPLPGTKTVGPTIRPTVETGASMKKDGMKGQLRAKASGAKPTNMMKPLGMTKMASGGKVRGTGIAQRGTKFIGEV